MTYTTEPMDGGMVRVLCADCGQELGAQDSRAEPPEDFWYHSRCAMRVAKHWELGPVSIEGILALIQTVAINAYPEMTGKLRGISLPTPEVGEKVSKLRAEILAGWVLETLDLNGYKVVPK